MTCSEISLIMLGSIGLQLYPLLALQQHPDLAIHYRFVPDSEVMDAVLHNRFERGMVT